MKYAAWPRSGGAIKGYSLNLAFAKIDNLPGARFGDELEVVIRIHRDRIVDLFQQRQIIE